MFMSRLKHVMMCFGLDLSFVLSAFLCLLCLVFCFVFCFALLSFFVLLFYCYYLGIILFTVFTSVLHGMTDANI